MDSDMIKKRKHNDIAEICLDTSNDSNDANYTTISDLQNSSMNNNGNNSSNSSRSNKRMHQNNDNSSSDEIYLKLLVPSYAAGGIIGKGGEKIARIQKEQNIKMKMSKANDYFPSTNERICLLYGPIDTLLKTNDLIMKIIAEKPDNRSIDDERPNQIKILIHNNMAGSIIGKAGCHIKQIKDESGAHVQITPKQSDLYERIIIVEGDHESRNKALRILLKEFSTDAQYEYANITNISYTDLNSSSNMNSSHSSKSSNKHDSSSLNSASNGLLGPLPNSTNNLLLGLTKINELVTQNNATYSLQLTGLANLAYIILNCGGITQLNSDNLTLALRNSGYGTTAISEIIDAISVLINYGVINKPNSALTNNNSNNNNAVSGTANSAPPSLMSTPPSLMSTQTNPTLISASNSATTMNSSNNNNNNQNLLASLLGAAGTNTVNNSLINSASNVNPNLMQNQAVGQLLQLLTNSLLKQ